VTRIHTECVGGGAAPNGTFIPRMERTKAAARSSRRCPSSAPASRKLQAGEDAGRRARFQCSCFPALCTLARHVYVSDDRGRASVAAPSGHKRSALAAGAIRDSVHSRLAPSARIVSTGGGGVCCEGYRRPPCVRARRSEGQPTRRARCYQLRDGASSRRITLDGSQEVLNARRQSDLEVQYRAR